MYIFISVRTEFFFFTNNDNNNDNNTNCNNLILYTVITLSDTVIIM